MGLWAGLALVWVALNLHAQTAPTITVQPASQTNLVGATVVFNVTAAGTGPVTYQWQLNGTNLPNNNFITTVAGNGSASYAGDGGAATNASLNSPSGLALDRAGNLYVADWGNNRIRRVDTNRMISTVAGNGTNGYAGDGGAAISACLSLPNGVAADANGILNIADRGNNRVRRVDATGIINTLAGNGKVIFAGDGGAAGNASINLPFRVVLDAFGNLFLGNYIQSYPRFCLKIARNPGLLA